MEQIQFTPSLGQPNQNSYCEEYNQVQQRAGLQDKIIASSPFVDWEVFKINVNVGIH